MGSRVSISPRLREWADEYGFTTPVVVDSAYGETGYLLPGAVVIPAEALLRPGIELIDNPKQKVVSEKAIEKLLEESK